MAFINEDQILFLKTEFEPSNEHVSANIQVSFYMDPNAQYIGFFSLTLYQDSVWLIINECVHDQISYQPSESSLKWKFEIEPGISIVISYGDKILINFVHIGGSEHCLDTWSKISSSIQLVGSIVTSFKIISKYQGELHLRLMIINAMSTYYVV